MSKIQIVSEGFGRELYRKLVQQFERRRGKRATEKCLKSGKLYLHSIGDPQNPEGIMLRDYRHDICTAYKDGRIELEAYNSTTTRDTLWQCTKLQVNSVGEGHYLLNGTVLYSGTITIDAKGMTEENSIVDRRRSKQSVLRQFQVLMKPYEELIALDMRLMGKEVEIPDDWARKYNSHPIQFVYKQPTPTLADARALLAMFDDKVKMNWNTKRNAYLEEAHKRMRTKLRDAHMLEHDGYVDAPYDLIAKKYVDGRKYGA